MVLAPAGPASLTLRCSAALPALLVEPTVLILSPKTITARARRAV